MPSWRSPRRPRRAVPITKRRNEPLKPRGFSRSEAEVEKRRRIVRYVMAQEAKNPVISCVRNRIVFGGSAPMGDIVPRKRSVTPARRAGVLHSDRVCRYCGGPAQNVDHIWPLDYGGCNNYHNLVAACNQCNQRKGNLFVKEAGMVLFLPVRFFNKRAVPSP